MTHDEFMLTRLRDEVALQCRFIGRGWAQLDAKPDEEGFWFAVHGITSSAATISRLLWPNRRTRRVEKDGISTIERIEPSLQPERRKLREILQMTRSSPLFTRGVRNNFEHIDERIAEWNDTESTIFVKRTFDGHPLFAGLEFEPLGAANLETSEVRFGGHKVNLREIRTEANRILDRMNEYGWNSV